MSTSHIKYLKANAEKMGYTEASKVLGISRQAVHQLCNKHNIKMKGRGPIPKKDYSDRIKNYEKGKFYLYIVAETEEGPCKIGIAGHVASRIETLQLGNYRELKCFYSRKIGNAKSETQFIEKKIHNMMSDKLIRREWFAYTVAEIRQMIDREASELVAD